MDIADIYLLIVFSVPIYVLLILTYFYPEESMLFGRRWMFKEEPEISEGAIRYTKIAAIVSLVVLTIVLVTNIF
ncbi:hypothetical protein [Neobacillus sp. YIM B06451]|uniref:hypothetical protein n=1 Tax=Neobacillus sp. YIM B06451 TaxID=3070994 RepID=UPI002931EA26|nr:hypothetical protein [Neobacillus sp. YIM B06451]